MIAIIFLLLFANCTAQPSFVFNLNRHSVREPRDSSPHEGGALLLNSAYERLYLKGKHLRAVYPHLLSDGYKPNDIIVSSSSWERTITTAHGILAGLFETNDTRKIPVYSTPVNFDYTIYNYDKCPNYDSTWNDFQKTEEWKQQVIKYSNLTNYLNNLLRPKGVITLANLFSTWDLYWIQQNRPEVGQLSTPIDQYTYNILSQATNWVETTKYSARISGNYLGSSLLNEIKYRMNMFISKNPVLSHKWISTSAHYATQLNLLATLGYNGIVSKSIPDYNSIITFELHNRTNDPTNFPSGWSIKIKYWDGLPNDNYTPIVIADCIEGQDCEIDYNLFWSMYKTKDLEQWCKDCNNVQQLCLGFKTSQIINNGTTDTIQIAILVIVSFLTLFSIIGITALFSYSRKNIFHSKLEMNSI